MVQFLMPQQCITDLLYFAEYKEVKLPGREKKEKKGGGPKRGRSKVKVEKTEEKGRKGIKKKYHTEKSQSR